MDGHLGHLNSEIFGLHGELISALREEKKKNTSRVLHVTRHTSHVTRHTSHVTRRDYDIMFWSQTNWNWVEMKLTEMGILQV